MNMGKCVLPNPYNALLRGEIHQFFIYHLFALHGKFMEIPVGFPFSSRPTLRSPTV